MAITAWVRLRSEDGFGNNRIAGWMKLPVLALVACLAWLSLLPNTRTTPIFGDEVSWIASSSYTSDLVLSGTFDWSHWNPTDLGPYGPMNPPLGKLALGLPLRLGNHVAPFHRLWDWSLNEQENRAQGNLPSPALFQSARRVAATHAALLAAVVCALGWEVGGLSLGLLAAGLLGIHPVWRQIGSMVLTDMLLCSALLLMAFPAIRLLRRSNTDRGLGPMAALGLLMGIAAAIKPTGLVMGGFFLAATVAFRALRSRRVRPHVTGLTAALVVAGSTMVALDPWLWPDPMAARPSVILREAPLAFNALSSPHPVAALQARRPQLGGLESLGRPALVLVRAKQWKNLVEVQRTLPSLQWEAPRILVLSGWLLWSLVSFPGEAIFVLVGIWGTLRTLKSTPDGGGRSYGPSTVLALIAAAATAYTMLFVVLPVPRYLLPLFALLQLLAAHGILLCLQHTAAPLRRLCEFSTRD